MNLQIETTQNVAITFEAADPVTRCWAGLIDALIGGAYLFAVFTVLTGIIPNSRMSEGTATIVVICTLLPWLFYDFLCEVLMHGQSFGKQSMKIRVIRLDGTEPRVGDYALRWLLGLLEFKLTMCSLAALALLFSRSGQRLGDRVAGTTVVRVVPQAKLRDTIYRAVDENYTPLYPAVEHLSPDAVELIREVVRERDLRGDTEVVRALATTVRDTMNVTPNEAPLDFLRTVLKDYNALHGTSIEAALGRAARPVPKGAEW